MVDAYPLPERYQVVYRCGENEGIADTLRDRRGAQVGLHPHELLEAALASCMTITARLAAERLGVPDARTSVRVWLERADGVATFHHEVDLDPRLSEGQRRYVRQRVADCPVRQTLSGALHFIAEPPAAAPGTGGPGTAAPGAGGPGSTAPGAANGAAPGHPTTAAGRPSPGTGGAEPEVVPPVERSGAPGGPAPVPATRASAANTDLRSR